MQPPVCRRRRKEKNSNTSIRNTADPTITREITVTKAGYARFFGEMSSLVMNRTKSILAQSAFSLTNKLQHLAHHGYRPVRPVARLLRKLAIPLSRRLGKRHLVSAQLYGHDFFMPAEHQLAFILARFPQCNRPLGLAARAIYESARNNSPITVIDVGANIGETVAIIDEQLPGVAHYLCIEADREIYELCKLNHLGNERVLVERRFIGEDEGTPVWLQDDGRANPSTKRSLSSGNECAGAVDRLVRLDTAAERFVGLHGPISLLKVDTEGYDFSVLRSASRLLHDYRPALYFEWFPKLLLDLHEDVWSGFEYLKDFGYRSYVFFTSHGNYYCKLTDPDRLLLRSLAAITLKSPSMEYFDVFVSQDATICDHLVESCMVQPETLFG